MKTPERTIKSYEMCISQFSYVLGLIYEIANLKHFSTSRFKTGGRLKSQDTLTEKNAFYKFAKLSGRVLIFITTPEELIVLFKMQFTYLDIWQTMKWFPVTTQYCISSTTVDLILKIIANHKHPR